MQEDIRRALEKPEGERRWGMVIDLRKCVGCHACTVGCVAENKLPPGVVYRPVLDQEIGEYPKTRIGNACTYPTEGGLVVQTHSERVLQARRMVLELLLARCPKAKLIQDLAAEHGVFESRFKTDDPEELCILCGLCVRACRDVVGVSAISMADRSPAKLVTTPFLEQSAACIGCVSCAFICATNVPLVLGANVGGTSVAFIASSGLAAEGRRVAWGHLALKASGALLFLPLLPFAQQAIASVSRDGAHFVATAHTCLNLSLAVLFFPWVGRIADLLTRMIPAGLETVSRGKPVSLDREHLPVAGAALGQVAREIVRMADMIQEIHDDAVEAVCRGDVSRLDRIAKTDDEVVPADAGDQGVPFRPGGGDTRLGPDASGGGVQPGKVPCSRWMLERLTGAGTTPMRKSALGAGLIAPLTAAKPAGSPFTKTVRPLLRSKVAATWAHWRRGSTKSFETHSRHWPLTARPRRTCPRGPMASE